ncbi:hypothetical protein THIX_20108 [Thiomonas sp. X19]|nr:hypothetical protein THIX_20108 [Thiomonas sp. X19]
MAPPGAIDARLVHPIGCRHPRCRYRPMQSRQPQANNFTGAALQTDILFNGLSSAALLWCAVSRLGCTGSPQPAMPTSRFVQLFPSFSLEPCLSRCPDPWPCSHWRQR